MTDGTVRLPACREDRTGYYGFKNGGTLSGRLREYGTAVQCDGITEEEQMCEWNHERIRAKAVTAFVCFLSLLSVKTGFADLP